ncbi:MAG: hypothetical protein PVF45_06565, partial [Anaerolineae bacterium]
WWFRIVHKRTHTLHEMGQEITRASTLTETDLLAAISALTTWVRVTLTQGDSVRIEGIGTFSLSANGLADEHNARLDSQQLDVVFRPDPQLRRYIRTHAERKRVVVRERFPEPRQFIDVVSERRDAYTAGSIGKLYGHTLKLDPADPAQGVFFRAEDGTERRAEIYSHVGDRWVHFLIPGELVGVQELLVRAQPRFAPDVREGKLRQKLVNV